MPTTTLRQMLDLPMWQALSPSPVTNAANMLTTDSAGPDQLVYYITSTTVVWTYNPSEDSWNLLPSPALATFTAGACARWHPSGPTGTALAGSTSTTLKTNITVLNDLSAKNDLAFKVRITGGTGAGQERSIESATFGPNSVITVSTPWSVTPDDTSTYALMTGRVYIMGGGTTAAGSFKYWDYATATWSGNLSVSGFPTFGTDGKIAAPNSITTATKFTGTATGGSATTLVNSAKTWTVNQFRNWQVRITAGAGAGEIRAITANTADTLTIATGTAIDATSQYTIEPSDDFLYVAGNNAVALYRYSISANTWSTLSPVAARAAAPGAALSLQWIHGVTQSEWSDESAVINGNRLYSFRANGTNTLDCYDIAANTWVSNVTYGQQNQTIPSGSSYVYDGGNFMYIAVASASGTPTRFIRFDLRAPAMRAFATNPWPNAGNALLGDKIWMTQYGDGTGSPLKWVYIIQQASTQMHRYLIW